MYAGLALSQFGRDAPGERVHVPAALKKIFLIFFVRVFLDFSVKAGNLARNPQFLLSQIRGFMGSPIGFPQD